MDLKQLNILPQKEAQFNKKNIYSVEDLVQFLPRAYKDFSVQTGILPSDQVSCVTVILKSIKTYNTGRIPFFKAFCDVVGTGEFLVITWFRQNYLASKLAPYVGQTFLAAGKIEYNSQYQNYAMNGPELFALDGPDARRIYPIYSKISGMSDEYLTKTISDALNITAVTAELIPREYVKQSGQISYRDALYNLHFPRTMKEVEKGKDRLIFNDLLYFALHNEWAQRTSTPGSPYSVAKLDVFHTLKDALPYELTEDQAETVDQMIKDTQQGKRINALLQGDVGCGKTIVATLLMTAMADNGYQSVLMAPTQVLARQHYNDISQQLGQFGIGVVYLGSELKAKERKDVLAKIASGEAQIIIGTHSVLGEDVVYHKLSLTIVDEQHKFGVAQRVALVEKAAAGVHSINMSATPIPRSLAQVIYGGAIQLYNIKTMPAGRKPVITGIASSKDKLYKYIINAAKRGEQAYVVCPLIEASDKLDGVKSVEEVSDEYHEALDPYGIRIATLTGKNSKTETDETINAFKNGGIDVLIATTVIEVGVNVPTATLMIISNAERFGLAALHQLRGRVGRSNLQAYCVMECMEQTEKAQMRMDAMCSTTDGFKIAEADLAIRGAGDFIGTRQSGENKYLTLMIAYPDKYDEARAIAKELLDSGSKCSLMKRVMAEREDD